MHYWGTEENVSKSGRTPRPAHRVRKTSKTTRGKGRRGSAGGSSGGRDGSRQLAASGGSVKDYPFLRRFYRQHTDLSDRLQRVLFFLFLAALIYVFVLADSGAIKITQLRLKRARLDENIAVLEQTSEQLAKTIERLETNDFYIEKIGRERYGYVRPGDKVYKLIPIDDRDF
jgi:cell division protein FtsB